MSAFIVTDATMTVAVGAVIEVLTQGGRIPSSRALFDGMPACDANGTAIGRALFAMNERAMDARYPGRWRDDYAVGEPLSSEAFSYRGETRNAMCRTVAERHKAIDCLLYQCSEGEVDQEPLFLALTKVRETLSGQIIRATAAWNAAPWDFPEEGDGGDTVISISSLIGKG